MEELEPEPETGGPEQEQGRTRRTESGIGTEGPKRKPEVAQDPRDSEQDTLLCSSFLSHPHYIQPGIHAKLFHTFRITSSPREGVFHQYPFLITGLEYYPSRYSVALLDSIFMYAC